MHLGFTLMHINIIAKRWYWGPSLLELKRWRLRLNTQKETTLLQLVWVTFPSLPMELCIKNALKTLGEALGKLIQLEVDFHTKVDNQIMKILVELNLWKGLVGEI